MHICQRNSRGKVRDKVRGGRERTVRDRDRDRETEQIETASLASGMRALEKLFVPSCFFFFFRCLPFSHLCSHFPLLWLIRKSQVLSQGWQFQARQLEGRPGCVVATHIVCILPKCHVNRKNLLLNQIIKEEELQEWVPILLEDCPQKALVGRC